ncbi:MAG: class beta-lactamase-related serine hydrolase [Gemmatimonadetes bacterium]|nr:class beta-lactamase-related serine hydrolase [Gemmatimonadota bacterium]
MRTYLHALAFVVLIPSRGLAQGPLTAPAFPSATDGWTTATPQSMGVDASRLAALTASVRAWPELGVHAILIERSGRLIYEEYFDGFDERWGTPRGRVSMARDSLHDVRSVTKSVISALVGLALADGAIKSLDQPVMDWFPEYPELNTPDRRRLTLRHVLGMTSGLQWDESVPYSDPKNDEIGMTRDSQPLRYVLSRPFTFQPGAQFNYNGGLVQVMAAVVQRAVKMPFQQYARARLFAPLGIDTVEWVGDLAGMPSAASGLRLRARDLAKFGSLYLHGGRWNGRQVLPADWVAQSTRRQFPFAAAAGRDRSAGTPADGSFGYSFFWWYSCYPTSRGLIEARTAVGNGQQRIFVLPGLDMVVTILSGRYNDFTTGNTLGTRLLREHVIPAVRSGVHAGCPGA